MSKQYLWRDIVVALFDTPKGTRRATHKHRLLPRNSVSGQCRSRPVRLRCSRSSPGRDRSYHPADRLVQPRHRRTARPPSPHQTLHRSAVHQPRLRGLQQRSPSATRRHRPVPARGPRLFSLPTLPLPPDASSTAPPPSTSITPTSTTAPPRSRARRLALPGMSSAM